MKKLLSVMLCAAMLLTSSASVFAAPGNSSNNRNPGRATPTPKATATPKPTATPTPIPTTKDVNVKFYIQRFGVIMDEAGKVEGRDSSLFTPIVGTGKLTSGSRNENYVIVYQEDVVSSDDVVKEVITVPSADEVFKAIQDNYKDNGYILSNSNKAVSLSNLSSEYYDIRWYVLKHESDAWHIDGVIIEKVTQLPVEIPVNTDPDYIPPEEVDPDYDPKATPAPAAPEPTAEPTAEPVIDTDNDKNEYTCNFAYIFGYDDTTMAAEEALLRCEVSAMIHRLVKQNNKLGGFKYIESNDPVFADIEGQWFRSAIEFMNYKGAFTARRGDNIYPHSAITRGEAFKLICIGLGFEKNTALSVNEYAEILKKDGYIRGDENGNINIDNPITRAEFCSVYNKIIGRDDAALVTASNEEITAETYGFDDLSSNAWYYEVMLRATSAYDNNGCVDEGLRGVRNNLDDYE